MNQTDFYDKILCLRLKKLEFNEKNALFCLMFYDYYEKTELELKSDYHSEPELSNSISEYEPDIESDYLTINSKRKNKQKNIKKPPTILKNSLTIRMSHHVSSELIAYYKKNRYPNDEEKINLARKLKVTLNQVKTWFYNRRHRDNKKKY